MISLRFVDSCDAIPESLWQACFPPPHEGLWWYRALQDSGLEEQFTFFYGVIEAADEHGAMRPVGIAPCFLADVPLETVVPKELMFLFTIPAKLFPSVAYQRTLFIGSPCSDEGRVGLLPGIDRRAALLAVHDAAIAEAGRRHAPMTVWKDVPEVEKRTMAWLRTMRRLFGLPSYPNALVRFNSSEKDDYFAGLKGSRRYQLKKKLKASARLVQVTVEVVQNPPVGVLDEVFALFWQTFERSEIRFERLNRRFFELLAAEMPVHFILLREKQTGDLIAFMMCFVVGDRVINKFVGFDYARPKEWLLYFRLWEAAVDWSLGRGARGIQSGQTCYAPKIEQGHELIPLYNYGRHSNPIIHWIYSRVAKTITWQSLDEDLARYLKAHPEQEIAKP